MTPRRIVGTSALAVVVSCGTACAPNRPPNVPAEATAVNCDEGGWVHCWVDTHDQVNRCDIFNRVGEPIPRTCCLHDSDNVFVPDEGSGPVAQADLIIDLVHTTSQQVWLKNGVVLLPRNDTTAQRAYVNKIKAIMRQLKTEEKP